MSGAKGKTQGPEGFTEGRWRGKPRYQCSSCTFDSTSKPKTREHVETAHPKGVKRSG